MKELVKTDITVGANIEDGYVAMCITSDDNNLTKLRIAPETARIVARNLLAQVDEVEADQAEENSAEQSPRMPLTAEEVEAMTDSPNEISRELLLQIERREDQSRYKPLDLSRKVKDEGVENGKH